MVSGWRRTACSFAPAWARWVMAMWPRSSLVVPNTCWWRRAHMANHCGGTRNPDGASNWPSPSTCIGPAIVAKR
jgi:hypothetical protein